MKTAALALALAALVMVGCGVAETKESPYLADHYLDGIGIRIEPGTAAWTHDADFKARLTTLIQASVTYSGESWNYLQGYVIVFTAENSPCGSGVDTWGCTNTKERWIAVSSLKPKCLEDGVLPHEILHAILVNDRCHSSPLWRDFQSVADVVNATNPTYVDMNGNVLPCLVVPSNLTMNSDC